MARATRAGQDSNLCPFAGANDLAADLPARVKLCLRYQEAWIGICLTRMSEFFPTSRHDTCMSASPPCASPLPKFWVHTTAWSNVVSPESESNGP